MLIVITFIQCYICWPQTGYDVEFVLGETYIFSKTEKQIPFALTSSGIYLSKKWWINWPLKTMLKFSNGPKIILWNICSCSLVSLFLVRVLILCTWYETVVGKYLLPGTTIRKIMIIIYFRYVHDHLENTKP